jgi:hypothetical protein
MGVLMAQLLKKVNRVIKTAGYKIFKITVRHPGIV